MIPTQERLSHSWMKKSKASDDTDTRTTVTQLDEEGRIRQLALISSGEVTDASMQAARELFERNRS